MNSDDRTITGELADLRDRVEVIEKALGTIQRAIELLTKIVKLPPVGLVGRQGGT